MSISTQLRGALQVWAAAVVGFPAADQIDYEGVGFTPTVGTSWARFTLLPGNAAPYDVAAKNIDHTGELQLDIFCPANGSPGTEAVETIADAVRDRFAPGVKIATSTGNRIKILYSRRMQVMTEPDWLQIPVRIGYRLSESRL